MSDDGVNLTFFISYDGVNFIQGAQVARTSFMAGGPDQVGIVLTNENSAFEIGGSFLSWIIG